MYTLEAGLLSSNTRSYPGVYTVKALSENMVGADMTIGIPSLNDDITLKEQPTKESPAIIMGAAVPYEKKVGPVDFKKFSDGALYAPYSKFRYEIIEEANLNGTGTHKKMSGFDGTYFIIRVDVSDLVSGNNGKVLNTQSLAQWRHDEGSGLDISIPGYETGTVYTDKDGKEFQLDAGLESPLAHAVSLNGQKYNTNVHIYKDATVVNYAYGGGLGTDAVVSGTTYIDLLGGTVTKDLYAAGT